MSTAGVVGIKKGLAALKFGREELEKLLRVGEVMALVAQESINKLHVQT